MKLSVICLAALLAVFYSYASQQPKRPSARARGQIIIGAKASQLEQYAAKELQRYLYQITGTWLEITKGVKELKVPSFVIGAAESNPAIRRLIAEGHLAVSSEDPGPQGYVLKRLEVNKRPVIAIAGSDEIGCLYGVYGLLADYYHIGFFLGGDVLPDKKSPLTWVDVDEKKAPAMSIRGFLPWTNFPQSATVYSWEDWKFIIDQMAKMRMNFIHIHNYNGELGHNEMYHNFTYKGYTSRVWMPTARTGHKWACPGWDVNKYLFGASDLFDDYDFGADCALHNENLSNKEVFRKSASLFRKVIEYAHTRGVKIGLGLDINLIPEEYKAKPEDPEVVQARVDQLVNDYPDLDYLLCFQSEVVGKNVEFHETWRRIFMGFYDGVKARMPGTRVAVAGWGLDPKSIETLPADVICAPIAPYSDACESGAIYGDREYWGCPWLERDFNSSEYYYPYRMHLSNTIAAYQNRAPNMKGFYCLTWRLTDAVEAKMWYMSKAPWDHENRYNSSEAVYRDYAGLNYGPEAADEITGIINQNEPFACDFGECEGTGQFAPQQARYLFNLSRFRFSGDSATTQTEYLAAAHTSQQGVWHAPWDEGADCVVFNRNGDWAAFDSVDVGRRATRFEARVATVNDGVVMELRIDSSSGPVIGTLNVNSTGGIQRWESVAIDITPFSGSHKLFLNFVPSNEAPNDDAKAAGQLAVIDKWINEIGSPARRARLRLLRSRIAAVKDHIELNRDFPDYKWGDFPGVAESWIHNFISRVTDISSLGNVMSTQNRYVQLNYDAKESDFRTAQEVKAPSAVNARGTRKGAVITWKNEQPGVLGFNVYRDTVRVNPKLLSATVNAFSDKANGIFRYRVTSVDSLKNESPASIASMCAAGSADVSAPRIVVISPLTSNPEGQRVSMKARVLDNREYSSISATLRYRKPGTAKWRKRSMERRIKAVFTAQLSAEEVGSDGLEYYIEASDGDNTAIFPPSAPEMPLSVIACATDDRDAPKRPKSARAKGDTLTWSSGKGDVYWYRIYRSEVPGFKPGPASVLTYVDKGTRKFKDNGEGFDGSKFKGSRYYRVTAVDKRGNESPATRAVAIDQVKSRKGTPKHKL